MYMAALVQMKGEIETERTSCFQTDAFLVWGQLWGPQYIHTVHIQYRKSIHLGGAGSLCTYAKPEVDIDSNPEGLGTHQVGSTCNTLGSLGSTEAIDWVDLTCWAVLGLLRVCEVLSCGPFITACCPPWYWNEMMQFISLLRSMLKP